MGLKPEFFLCSHFIVQPEKIIIASQLKTPVLIHIFAPLGGKLIPDKRLLLFLHFICAASWRDKVPLLFSSFSELAFHTGTVPETALEAPSALNSRLLRKENSVKTFSV